MIISGRGSRRSLPPLMHSASSKAVGAADEVASRRMSVPGDGGAAAPGLASDGDGCLLHPGACPTRPAFFLAELGFIAEQRGDAETALSPSLNVLTTVHANGDPHTRPRELAGAQPSMNTTLRPPDCWGAVGRSRPLVGVPLSSAERSDINHIIARALSALGEDVFATEFERGPGLDSDDCVSHAIDP